MRGLWPQKVVTEMSGISNQSVAFKNIGTHLVIELRQVVLAKSPVGFKLHYSSEVHTMVFVLTVA